MEKKVKVGDTLVTKSLEKVTVEWVGNKYFTIKEDVFETKISIDDLYMPPYRYRQGIQLYLSEQAVKDEAQKQSDTIEMHKTIDEIKNFINSCLRDTTKIDTIRKMRALIPNNPT